MTDKTGNFQLVRHVANKSYGILNKKIGIVSPWGMDKSFVLLILTTNDAKYLSNAIYLDKETSKLYLPVDDKPPKKEYIHGM